VLAELSPERKAVAEQILRGGIPAVRQAVEEQNAQAREVGGPEIKVDALLVVAEELLPALRAAEWRDRADAAIGIVDEISVRDLRAVVSGADTARDEEGRALAAQLRDALDRRAASERQNWVDEVSSSLDDGRIVRALRISGRPPEPGVRFPADLAKRLSDAAGEALTPDATPDRWAAVLEAVVASPARRTITPKGLPAEPGEALTKALRQAAARVPAIATLLGDPPGAPPRRPPKPTGPRTVSDPTRPPGRPTTPPPSRAVGAAGVAAPQTSGASGVDLAPPAAGGAPEPEPEPATIADAPAEATPEAEVATSTEVDETVNTELEPGPPGAELVDDETAAPPDDAAAAAPSLSDADERAEPSAAAPSAGTPTEASAERADASGPAAPGVDDMAPPLPPAPESGAEPPGAQVEVAPSRADGPVVGNGVPADELNATVAPD
jgi:hypothetical protein